jgi:RNA polymerase sigma-70 factor (ECF subfamily)
MTEGRDEADEIFQEVWLRAIRNLDRFKAGNFPGWLVRIAHNLIVDRARKRRPEASLDAEDEDARPLHETVPAAGLEPSREAAATDLGRRIAAAVDALGREQKEVFLMRTQMGLTFKEIARVQKASINTVLARMHYALGKLRPVLATEYRDWVEGKGGGS